VSHPLDSGWAPRSRSAVLGDLARRGFSFRKRLGQNFLFDPQLLEAFLDDAQVEAGELILEVGAGAGTLTERLLARDCKVIAAEIDPLLVDYLEGRGPHPQLTLVAGDALGAQERLSPALESVLDRENRPYRLVANLPYAIATPLVMRLLARDLRFTGMATLVQLEVAERWGATAGCREYGPSSVLFALGGGGRITRKVAGHLFTPAPRVGSAFFVWEPNGEWGLRSHSSSESTNQLARADFPAFLDFTRRLFQNRRKMIRAILRDDLPPEGQVWEQIEVDPSSRPEELSPVQILSLYRVYEKNRLN